MMTLREALVVLKASPRGWLVVKDGDETIQVKFHPTYRYCVSCFSSVSNFDRQCECGELLWEGCEHTHIYSEFNAEQKIRSKAGDRSVAALNFETSEGYISIQVWL